MVLFAALHMHLSLGVIVVCGWMTIHGTLHMSGVTGVFGWMAMHAALHMHLSLGITGVCGWHSERSARCPHSHVVGG